MLAIEMEDVLGVLKTCSPYLIALGAILLVCVIAMIACRKMSRRKKFLIRGEALVAMGTAIVVVVNTICFGPMSTLIGLATGSGTVSEETAAEAMKIAERAADEGFVLLENEGLLPLIEKQGLNLFGWASANPLYGGSGSGGINDLYPIVSLKQGLEQAGFQVNEALLDFYNTYTAERPEMSIQKQSWTLPEPPAAMYPEELIQEAKEFSDVAVIVLSRMAGEGHNDMPDDVSKVAFDHNSSDYLDFEAGQHYLEPSKTELDMIELVCSNFENVVVIYNGANPMQLGFVDEYEEIKSVLWCPGPGNVGFNALGDILCGNVNPSGKTTDTFYRDVTLTPWWNNGFKADYENLKDMAVEGMNSGKPQVYAPSFVNYVEGIYVGYKFYETAAIEGAIDYEKLVKYPFGHGLSYTSFTQNMSEITQENGRITFDVTVTNTGDTAGKDVVEVYYNPPYTNGGIEKAAVNLIAFEKTQILNPGESETITISFELEDMASYDEYGAKAYVLEAGDYVISINSSSHVVLDEKTIHAAEDIVYSGENHRASDKTEVTNQFEDAYGDVTYLSRKDGFANFAEASAKPHSYDMPETYVNGYHLNANYDPKAYLNDNDVMPVTGAKNGMQLLELRGADYDDPRWETLLDQMTVEEMSHMIALAGYQTPAAESVGKVWTVDCDGPAAINQNFTGAGSVGFPVEVVLASTWNKELIEEYGTCMGKMCREMNVHGWYAPGMNMHRTPFCGRNYEYYSEDSILAGNMGAAAVKGAKSQGVYAFIKHYALYDFNGKMVCVWSNEQAIREIYLKPFEISVKDGGASAIMVSWSFLGNKWTGECSNLMKTVLRDEWGFRGMAVTDFFRNNGHGFMNADAALGNGVDAMLSTYAGGPNNVTDPTHPSAVLQMRQASKNILYTTVNSWAYDTDTIHMGALPWQKAAYVIDAAAAVLLAAAAIWIVKKSRNMEQ